MHRLYIRTMNIMYLDDVATVLEVLVPLGVAVLLLLTTEL